MTQVASLSASFANVVHAGATLAEDIVNAVSNFLPENNFYADNFRAMLKSRLFWHKDNNDRSLIDYLRSDLIIRSVNGFGFGFLSELTQTMRTHSLPTANHLTKQVSDITVAVLRAGLKSGLVSYMANRVYQFVKECVQEKQQSFFNRLFLQ